MVDLTRLDDNGPSTQGAIAMLDDRLVPWSPSGYGNPLDRPRKGTALVATPRATVEVLRAGYRPEIHPSARSFC